MPMPWAYRHATKDWKAFLADARDALGLESDNMTYTAVQGVLVAFRARLTPRQVVAFADLLPAVLRALFVSGWDPDTPPRPWTDRERLEAEARALRPDHNLTPKHPIEPVAIALRRNVRQVDIDRLLATFGPEAEAFWRVTSLPPEALERKIV